MATTSLTPSQCIDMHIDLVEWLRTRRGIEMVGEFNQLFGPGNRLSGPGNQPLNGNRFPKPEETAAEIYRSLSEADTFYVTAEMLQIAAETAEDLEGMPLFHRDLVSQNMLVLFDGEAGVTYGDYAVSDGTAHHWEFPLRALHIQHRPAQVRMVEDGQVIEGPEGLKDGAAIFYFSDPEGIAEAYRDAPLPGDGADTAVKASRVAKELHTPLVPLDFTAWAYGQQWSTMSWERRVELDSAALETGSHQFVTNTGQVSPHIGEQRRLLMSILLLMREEVYRERVQPDRAARRRWKASSVTRPEDYCVTVTKLRRVHDDGQPYEDDGEYHYSHRWAVRGHWRRIHKGSPEERAVWVRPHLKGPESAPFVPKGRVTMLDR